MCGSILAAMPISICTAATDRCCHRTSEELARGVEALGRLNEIDTPIPPNSRIGPERPAAARKEHRGRPDPQHGSKPCHRPPMTLQVTNPEC